MVATLQKRNPMKKTSRYVLGSSEVNGYETSSWWRFTDSNRGPVDYDSIALTD